MTKRNDAGLALPMDLNFVKEHDPPDLQLLKELIATEAVVGSINLPVDKTSLPRSVE